MTTKKPPKNIPDDVMSLVAAELGRRSADARKKKLGVREFKRQMRELGKRGGRPRKDSK